MEGGEAPIILDGEAGLDSEFMFVSGARVPNSGADVIAERIAGRGRQNDTPSPFVGVLGAR